MKRERKILVGIISFMMLILLAGCGETKQKNGEDMGNNEQNKPKATKEFIIEKFDLTDADLEGIDLDKLIEYYEFSEEVINEKTNETIVANLMMLHILQILQRGDFLIYMILITVSYIIAWEAEEYIKIIEMHWKLKKNDYGGRDEVIYEKSNYRYNHYLSNDGKSCRK